MISTKHYCQKCEKEIRADQKPCPFCGFNEVFITDKGQGNDNVKATRQIKIEDKGMGREALKIRQKLEGFKKFMKESIHGWFSSEDKNKHPEGVEKIRIIDREHPNAPDSYQERIKDIKTGKITRDIKEPLSQHKTYCEITKFKDNSKVHL